eukprot:1340-Heterococcus_DN1.PRE.7
MPQFAAVLRVVYLQGHHCSAQHQNCTAYYQLQCSRKQKPEYKRAKSAYTTQYQCSSCFTIVARHLTAPSRQRAGRLVWYYASCAVRISKQHHDTASTEQGICSSATYLIASAARTPAVSSNDSSSNSSSSSSNSSSGCSSSSSSSSSSILLVRCTVRAAASLA